MASSVDLAVAWVIKRDVVMSECIFWGGLGWVCASVCVCVRVNSVTDSPWVNTSRIV